MSKNLIPIFATQSDWSMMTRTAASLRPLKFVEAGLFDEPSVTFLDELDNVPPLTSYIVLDRASELSVEAVPQRRGGKKYAIDQLHNPDSIGLDLGGSIGHHHLVKGQIDTASDTRRSAEIFALFAKVVKERFTKVKSFYVGPEALRILDQGGRLSVTSRSPKEYDLIR